MTKNESPYVMQAKHDTRISLALVTILSHKQSLKLLAGRTKLSVGVIKKHDIYIE